MTLQEHTNYCLALIKQGYGGLKIIYSVDDEGNEYKEVYNKPSEFKVYNLSAYSLEPNFEYNESGENVLPFEPNCISIN